MGAALPALYRSDGFMNLDRQTTPDPSCSLCHNDESAIKRLYKDMWIQIDVGLLRASHTVPHGCLWTQMRVPSTSAPWVFNESMLMSQANTTGQSHAHRMPLSTAIAASNEYPLSSGALSTLCPGLLQPHMPAADDLEPAWYNPTLKPSCNINLHCDKVVAW